MAYELLTPYTEIEKAGFIVQYNRNQGLKIKEGTGVNDNQVIDVLYALEPDEIMTYQEVEIEVPDEIEDEETEITTHTETVTIFAPSVDPYYPENQLRKAKEVKYKEALSKAYDYQQNGIVEYKNCEFEMSDSNRKNLSDTEEALRLLGEESTEWLDKEDNLIELTVSDIQYIRLNLILAAIKELWIVKYPAYKAQIEEAETTEEVNAIEINYNLN